MEYVNRKAIIMTQIEKLTLEALNNMLIYDNGYQDGIKSARTTLKKKVLDKLNALKSKLATEKMSEKSIRELEIRIETLKELL